MIHVAVFGYGVVGSGVVEVIEKNKNLLPYPYDDNTTFQASLEDVGDGSFLTTGETTASAEIFLNDCSLPAGTYVSSVKVTDIIDSKTVTNPGFSLKIKISKESWVYMT